MKDLLFWNEVFSEFDGLCGQGSVSSSDNTTEGPAWKCLHGNQVSKSAERGSMILQSLEGKFSQSVTRYLLVGDLSYCSPDEEWGRCIYKCIFALTELFPLEKPSALLFLIRQIVFFYLTPLQQELFVCFFNK